jgi:DNA-binding SARP family transcriptional activator/thioredoxin-like negative regulator of GroEL
MIRFTCLGSVDLVGRDGAPVVEVLAQPKRVALLSYIALFNHGGFVPRDILLEVFWPESDTEHARNSLNQALHHLRSALGPEAFETRGKHEIRLSREAVWCDALAFRRALEAGRAGEATELYQGDLLEGIHASGGGGFERWMDGERLRLRRQFCDAAWEGAAEAEAAGSTATALHLAREAVAKAPFDELAVRRLMELLVRLGDRAEALKAYSRFTARLRAELDVEPDPETEELATAIRMHEPVATEPTAPATHSSGRPPPQSPPPVGPRRPSRTWSFVALAAVPLAALALARGSPPDETAAESTRNLVIVQPFDNRTGDESFDFVGLAAADAVAAGMNTRALDIAAVVTDDPEGFDVPEALVVTGFYEISGKQLALSSRVALASGEPLRLEGPVTGPATNANEALLELSDRIAVVGLSDPGSWTSEGHRASALPALTAPLPKWDAWREAARAEAHGARGEWGRALESLQRAVDIDPDFTAAHLRLALQYGNTGDWKMADSILSTVRARADDLNPLQRVNLDWLTAAMANDRQERLRLHRQNLALMGRTDDLQLAHELISLNRPREALEVLARLDEEDMLRNGVERFWTFHARAHHLLGDHEEELAATRTGSERFPSHLAVMRYEASALGAMGRVEELQALVEAAFSAPAHGGCCPTRVPLNGGLELLAHGHPEAARRLLERGADLHALRRQNTERESARHAEILLAAERWEEAAAILEELGAARPDKVAYVGGLGIIAARTGDRAGAARIFDELDPSRFFGMDQPVAVLFRARIAAAMGEDERAMQLLMDGTAAGLAVETALPQPEFVRLRSTEAFRRWAEPVG